MTNTTTATTAPATIFTPADSKLSPEVHFPLQTVFTSDRPRPYLRFINLFDHSQMLLVVDGSCLDNGRSVHKAVPPVAGRSFMYKSKPEDFFHNDKGPLGKPRITTSNRARLRAVIAALQFMDWHKEGLWRKVVILTDLVYIVQGATAWLPRWVAWRWRWPVGSGSSSGRGRYYLNRDLWEELQAGIEKMRAGGCEVAFWLVTADSAGEEGKSNKFIAQAKDAARRAAWEHERVPEAQMESFTRMCGIML
ncbi:hypothetical protein B0H66DRAFT_604791 [Apodospora peruviana]|uniref:RNase H type-1 domain-containing protein n=1 Tax=Apodospora peruviana TaxID=516989 RepID=A0AAE0I0X7_9PEZI|nr:hypothetical protein B0H66DRAFT_604791 [Apodospora peruviana]